MIDLNLYGFYLNLISGQTRVNILLLFHLLRPLILPHLLIALIAEILDYSIPESLLFELIFSIFDACLREVDSLELVFPHCHRDGRLQELDAFVEVVDVEHLVDE